MERWLSIKGFPSYEVSSEGRVKNSKTGRIMKINKNSKGYDQVCLRKDKQQYTKPIHRLVADTFFDGEHDGYDVNHIDGNKTNNFIGNLEWCTRKENVQHSFRTGLKKPSRMKKVRVVETGVVYESIRECARQTGYDQSLICQYLNGRIRSCSGLHFEIVD